MEEESRGRNTIDRLELCESCWKRMHSKRLRQEAMSSHKKAKKSDEEYILIFSHQD